MIQPDPDSQTWIFAGGNCVFAPVDVTKPEDVESALALTKVRHVHYILSIRKPFYWAHYRLSNKQ